MVSKASDDLPEPDRPVITTSRSRGRSRSTFFRLCSRAPRIEMKRCGSAAGKQAGVRDWAIGGRLGDARHHRIWRLTPKDTSPGAKLGVKPLLAVLAYAPSGGRS